MCAGIEPASNRQADSTSLACVYAAISLCVCDFWNGCVLPGDGMLPEQFFDIALDHVK